MRAATHNHKSTAFKHFSYRVSDRGIFVQRGDLWVKTTTEMRDLKPIGLSVSESVASDGKILLGTHKETGKLIAFDNVPDAENDGYSATSIYKCLAGDQNTHLGYRWRWSA